MALKLALVALVLVTVAVRNNDRLAASTLKGAEPCPLHALFLLERTRSGRLTL